MRCSGSALRAAVAGLALAMLAPLVTPSALAATAESERIDYRPPVDAPVGDTFRPPRSPYGPGNRGIDYATATGMPVRSAAAGVVAFAGPVAGGLHVVILHADGIRTSYSFLRAVEVQRGRRIGAGERVGVAGPSLHFGARAGQAYLDPLVLLAASTGVSHRVHLVPDSERKLHSEDGERNGLIGALHAIPGIGLRVAAAAVDWARQAPGAAVSVAGTLGAGTGEVLRWVEALAPSFVGPVDLVLVGWVWWERRDDCTPADLVLPPPRGRRIAVLVGGLGSSSESAAIYNVDTEALGYASSDVHRYSYRGGSTAENSYDADDTQVDIAVSGRRLRALVERLQAANPGVPIDILAHSQGGIVTRSALGQRAPPAVENVVTLGSPHEGADLATAAQVSGSTPKGALAQWLIDRTGISGIRLLAVSVAQLSEMSPFMRDLNSRPLPDGVRFTSIAARGDVTVPSPRSRLKGATYTIVSVDGINQHSALPGSDAATREIALAREGLEPTCESIFDSIADAAVGGVISTVEDSVGIALWGIGAR